MKRQRTDKLLSRLCVNVAFFSEGLVLQLQDFFYSKCLTAATPSTLIITFFKKLPIGVNGLQLSLCFLISRVQ